MTNHDADLEREGALVTAPGSEPDNQERMFQPRTIVAVAEHTEMTPERWQQITGMFHAALLRNSGPRYPLMKSACSVADISMLGSFLALCGSFWGVTALT